MTDEQRLILSDPQTSGGLLVSVDPQGRETFLEVTRRRGLNVNTFGHLIPTASSTRVHVH
jgi:selenide,water dikinase